MSINFKTKCSSLANKWNYSIHMRPLFTDLNEAVREVKKRKTDPKILSKIANFLDGDVPVHFNQSDPVFYLSRHLGSPNFEAIKAYEMTKKFGLQFVIGEDLKGIFVSNNFIKVPLGKLPILKGLDKNGNEILEYFTIIDFNSSQGKSFSDINTIWGQPMPVFHKELLANTPIKNLKIVDESNWINKHYRGNLYKQYVHILTIMCAHGILMEAFSVDEVDFVKKIVKPAFKEVERNIGVKPLIVEHITHEEELERTWDAYPYSLYDMIKNKLNLNL